MENVLNLFRSRELVPTTANIDLLLRCADVLRRLLEDTETSNEVDVSEYVEALAATITAGAGRRPPTRVQSAAPVVPPTPPDSDSDNVGRATRHSASCPCDPNHTRRRCL